MITERHATPRRSPLAPQTLDREGHGALLWAAALATMVACGVPFVLGVTTGWSTVRITSYGTCGLLFLALSQLPRVHRPAACWLLEHLAAYLLLMAGLALILQMLSADPFLQPMVFGVPFVWAALAYDQRRTFAVAVLYLGLMTLGLWLGGQRAPQALLFPLAGYGSLLGLIVAFTRLALAQSAARQRADRLAEDLARERDYLARLVQVTASLTQDLDRATVLQQVASAGRALAGADQVRVWLADATPAEPAPSALTLAASVPAEPTRVALAPRLDVLTSNAATATAESLLLPLRLKGQPIGVLELHGLGLPPVAEALPLLQPFADAAAIAIEHARLFAQAQLLATVEERNRLARELHDTIAQGLTAVTMQLEAASRSFERDATRTRARLTRATELTRATLDDVRRSVWTLAAPRIDGPALGRALEALTVRVAARTHLAIQYRQSGPPPPLDDMAATHVLRIVQEALANVEKHAQASAVIVRLATDPEMVCVAVEDNGVGFAATTPPGDPLGGSGFGLVSLRERARLAGGTLDVESAPGAGTRIRIRLPRLPHAV